jgi:small subunit ribosomal protein S6
VSKYELVYLVAPDTPEEKQTEIADRLKGYVQQLGGTLESLELWEKRKLAYEIRKVREAFYYIIRFEGDGKLVDELERRLKVADEVIRFLTVRTDEVQEVVEKRKAYHQKKREGLEKRKKKLTPAGDRPEPPQRERRPRHDDEVSHE